MELNTAFGLALKKVRKHQGLTQEDFSGVSSRTYLSSLERGVKGPTIEKVDQLSQAMGVHAVTLILLAYLEKSDGSNRRVLIDRIDRELQSLGVI